MRSALQGTVPPTNWPIEKINHSTDSEFFVTHRRFLVRKFPSQLIHVATKRRPWRQMTQCHTDYQQNPSTSGPHNAFSPEILIRVIQGHYFMLQMSCHFPSDRLWYSRSPSVRLLTRARWKAEGVKPDLPNKIRILYYSSQKCLFFCL